MPVQRPDEPWFRYYQIPLGSGAWPANAKGWAALLGFLGGIFVAAVVFLVIPALLGHDPGLPGFGAFFVVVALLGLGLHQAIRRKTDWNDRR